jgi:hypothetical protein
VGNVSYYDVRGEIEAIKAQFSAAADLFATAEGRAAKEKWRTTLARTLPEELHPAFRAFDIIKGYENQSSEFYNLLEAGAAKYYYRVEKTEVY